MAEKVDLTDLNIKSQQIFESSKSARVNSKEGYERNEGQLKEVNDSLKELMESMKTAVSISERDLIRRISVRLNSSVRFLQRFIDVYNDSQKMNKAKQERIKKAAEDRKALVESRQINSGERVLTPEQKVAEGRHIEPKTDEEQQRIENTEKGRGRPRGSKNKRGKK